MDDFLNLAKVLEVGESIKKNFGKHYTYCKRPRSAYIYFVKAARIHLKDRVQCSRDNFVEISRAISSKWNEMKVNQRLVFEDIATLDKRFNGFRIEQSMKKKEYSSHTPLFLKAKAEAKDHAASTSTGSSAITNLRNLLAARRARREAVRSAATPARTRTKRKTKRRKTKKRRTTSTRTRTTTSTASRALPTALSGVKSERFSIKSENKIKVKKEIKLKREF